MSDDEKNRKAIEDLLPGVTQVAAETRRAWAAWVLGEWDSPGCLEMRLAVIKALDRYRQDVAAVADGEFPMALPETSPTVWLELALAEAYVDEQRRREASKANAEFRESMVHHQSMASVLCAARTEYHLKTIEGAPIEPGLQPDPPAG